MQIVYFLSYRYIEINVIFCFLWMYQIKTNVSDKEH